MFADKYLKKNNNHSLFEENPASDLGLIVVIPCLQEPDISETLNSLYKCDSPSAGVEVIILINHSEIADDLIKEANRKTFDEIQYWISKNIKKGIQFYVSKPLELKKKWAGAGLARKKGMDEAVRRFNFNNNPNGIIVSLDADTVVDSNYLREIEAHFQNNKEEIGATLAFEHRKKEFNYRQQKGIELYEKYLHYYKNALDYCGYPYSLFTIGSAFAVKASAYVKRGGMNRRQAGEDFYFLQNLVQMGPVGEISSTKVYPSARLSNRVPFGTGPILQKWMNGEEDLNLTYNLKAFADLKQLFDNKEKLYGLDENRFNTLLVMFPEPVRRFIEVDMFWIDINDLNNNCSTLESFQNRFFQKFNAFKILKYLNFVHEHFYCKTNMERQIALLNQKQQA